MAFINYMIKGEDKYGFKEGGNLSNVNQTQKLRHVQLSEVF